MKNTLFVLFLMLSTTLFSQKIETNSSCEVTYKVIRDSAFQIEQNDISERFEIDLKKKTVEIFHMDPYGDWNSTFGVMKIKDSTMNFKKRKGGFVEVFCPDTKKTLVIWVNSHDDNKFELYTYWKNEYLVYFKDNLTVNIK